MRDRFVHFLIDFLVEHCTSKWYRKRLHIVFGGGLAYYAGELIDKKTAHAAVSRASHLPNEAELAHRMIENA